MHIERGALAGLPYAAVGSGPSVVILPGLAPVSGVGGDGYVRSCLAPVHGLGPARRLVVLGRRPGLPPGLTMAALAAEHAAALRAGFDGPVDVLGVSTGGVIAQQLAADHPEVVRRLVLAGTACRLGATGRARQAEVAQLVRDGQRGPALGAVLAELVPPRRGRRVAAGLGHLLGPLVLRDPIALADLAATVDAEDGFDLATCAAQIRAQTLVVSGGRDRFYPPELVEETTALIPGSRSYVFPRRGHLGLLGDRRCRAVIAGFLQGAPADDDGPPTAGASPSPPFG